MRFTPRWRQRPRGIETVLKKQAAGFAEVVSAAGGDPNAALKLLIADKLEDLMRIQVDAIRTYASIRSPSGTAATAPAAKTRLPTSFRG